MNINFFAVIVTLVQFALLALGVGFLITGIWFMIRSHKLALLQQQKLDRMIELLESRKMEG